MLYHFLKTLKPKARKTAQKNEKHFLQMCLRFKFCPISVDQTLHFPQKMSKSCSLIILLIYVFFPLLSFQYIYAIIKTTYMNWFCVLLWPHINLHPRRFVAIYAKTDTICTWSFPGWVSTDVRPPVRPDIKVINGHWLRCLINYLPSSDGKGWAVYMAHIYPLCLGTFATFKISKVAVFIAMSNMLF
jgi:hypothetical protein